MARGITGKLPGNRESLMEDKVIPAPGRPNAWQRFRGGALQVAREQRNDPPLLAQACPFCWVIGRVAAWCAAVVLVGIVVLLIVSG